MTWTRRGFLWTVAATAGIFVPRLPDAFHYRQRIVAPKVRSSGRLVLVDAAGNILSEGNVELQPGGIFPDFMVAPPTRFSIERSGFAHAARLYDANGNQMFAMGVGETGLRMNTNCVVQGQTLLIEQLIVSAH